MNDTMQSGERDASSRIERPKREERVERAKAKRTRSWAVIILLIVIAVGGLGYVVVRDRIEAPSRIAKATEVQDGEWVKGNPEASVTIIEYGDFQCPACGAFFPLVRQLVEEHGESFRFAYRHFPIRSAHPWADLAARASEASGLQGKFFEMHDLLFANQNDWATSRNPQGVMEEYATKIGLDLERFRADIESDAVAAAVESDFQNGLASRISGTPTFFLNGEAIQNPPSYEAFRTIILDAAGGDGDAAEAVIPESE